MRARDDGFVFPRRPERIVVETGLMRQTMHRTMLAVQDSGIVVWSGPARMGKTTTAKLQTDRINSAYDPTNPDAFRAIYYEVAGTPKAPGQRVLKHGIKSLHTKIVGPLDSYVYHRDPPEALAGRVVAGLQIKAVQMVFVDEAGTLSLEEIRGMVAVRNQAADDQGWPLTLVFVGMDELPATMLKLPQIEGRVHTWCPFDPYDLEDTWTLLAALSPYFARLRRTDPAHCAQVAFVHERYEGVPGKMVPFLRLLAERLADEPTPVCDLLFLQAVHEDLRLARQRIVEMAEQQWRPTRRRRPPDGHEDVA